MEDKDIKDITPVENPDGNEKKPFEVESEWAEKLGMDFDEKKAQTPPPVPEEMKEQTQTEPPLYFDQGKRPYADQYPQFGTPYPNAQIPPIHPVPMPKTYMVWAIFSTICCCLATGIIAIIYSASVSTKYYMRDYAGAEKASEYAQMWIIASIVLGVISNTIYMPLTMLLGQ